MVILMSTITGLGVGFVAQGISVFFKPLAADLQLSRAATSVATGVARMQGGIEAPLAGWLSDRSGPKWVIVSGLCIVIVGLVLMYFADSPWQYYIFWGVMIGIGENLALTIAIDKSLSDWFIARRGLAFGVRFAIIGICQVLVIPLITWLVLLDGWRVTCLIWAGVLAPGIPLTLIFVKSKRPEYYGLFPDGYIYRGEAPATGHDLVKAGKQYAESFEEHEFTVRQAVKTGAFWLILLAWSCSILVAGGFTVHVVPFLTDMGISETMAGAMFAMMLFFTIPSRFFAGFLADRVSKNRLKFIAAVFFLVQALGFIVFLASRNIFSVYVLLIIYGFGNGAVTPFRLSMGGRFFGRQSFGSILGVGMFISAPLGLLAPIYTGHVYDTTGSYANALLTFAILLIAATLVLLIVRTPELPQPAPHPDIRGTA
jgi:OFA family oxalate/formate antiporter-like MFS transporter